jgi:imidazolonepropionase
MSNVTLFCEIRELVPLTDGPEGAVRGEALDRAAVIPDGAIAVQGGKVLATGPRSELESQYPGAERVELGDCVVVPAFVDAHTHPAFAATREHEFTMRCAGADYVDISKAGGGILSSVRTLREIEESELVDLVYGRLVRFLDLGTVCIEAKSGYGLDLESELKSLRAIEKAASELPITVHKTFLGAHEIAPEYRDKPDAYVDLLVEEMLPAAKPFADACDVFVEDHVFSVEQGRRILSKARELGYRIRAHVDELAPLGGAELAVELGADSADHLLYVSDAGIDALAGSETTAVLLPGTSFFLRKGTLCAGAPAHRSRRQGRAGDRLQPGQLLHAEPADDRDPRAPELWDDARRMSQCDHTQRGRLARAGIGAGHPARWQVRGLRRVGPCPPSRRLVIRLGTTRWP